jgi:hypothetical protein
MAECRVLLCMHDHHLQMQQPCVALHLVLLMALCCIA